MNEPKHSALPWTEFGHTVVCKNADGKTTPVLQIETTEDPHLAYWNMDFVIRACNAHDALMDVMEAAARLCCYAKDNNRANEEHDAWIALEAAIAKADGAALED